MTILVLGARGRVAGLLRGAMHVLGIPARFAGRTPTRPDDTGLDPGMMTPAQAVEHLDADPSLIHSSHPTFSLTAHASRSPSPSRSAMSTP